MINVFGLLTSVLIIAGGIMALTSSRQTGVAGEVGLWGFIAGGVLLGLACLQGMRSRTGPDMRLMLAAMAILCAVALSNLIRYR